MCNANIPGDYGSIFITINGLKTTDFAPGPISIFFIVVKVRRRLVRTPSEARFAPYLRNRFLKTTDFFFI